MAKKLIITVNEDYQYPKKSKVKMPKDKLYKETSIVRVRDASLDKTMSLEGQMKQVDKDINNLETIINFMYISYISIKYSTTFF